MPANGTIVVTGAASGIGQAIAVRASRDRQRLVIVDVRDQTDTANMIKANGAASAMLTCDLRNETAVQEMFAEIEQSHGGADILINCAGTMGNWPLTLPETTTQEYDNVFGVNVRGTYLCCREAVSSMRSRGQGSIVNIGSELAFKAAPGATLYCAAKAAVVQLTRALAVEEAPNGIRVNVVCPGPVDTTLLNPTVGAIPANIAAQSCEQTALRRLGTPEEIAEVVWFVANDKASYMTGAVIPVDGGALAT